MNQRMRGIIGALSLVVVGASACSKREPAEKAETAPEAPVTAGYESAIAAHAMKPIFRPNGTAPAVWGPGDLYNLLATGEETNNAFFQFEAIVPTGGGLRRTFTAARTSRFMSSTAAWRSSSAIRPIRPRPVTSSSFREGPFTDLRTWAAARPFSW